MKKSFLALLSLFFAMQTLRVQIDVNHLIHDAQSGDVAAMWELGKYYYEKDQSASDEAGYWLQKAYKKEKDNADGLYFLGCWFYYPYYENPNELQNFHSKVRDQKAGFSCIKRSAELGNLDAALFMFKHYRPNNSPNLFSPKSEWHKYNKMAENAMKYAGIALAATPDTTFDDYLTLARAAFWCDNPSMQLTYAVKAVDKEEWDAIDYMIANSMPFDEVTNPKALYDAASKLWRRGNDTKNDGEIGLKLFEKSANLDYMLAQSQMGYIYLRGTFVGKDTLKAIAWFKEAAKKGNAKSKNLIAYYYQIGKYLPINQELAFKMFMETAKTGDQEGIYQIGNCYEQGWGVDKDNQKALEYFSKVEHVFADAPYRIGAIYYEQNDPKAIEYLEPYIEQEKITPAIKANVLKLLSQCSRFGRCGVPVDVKKADALLSLSAEFGNPDAMKVHDLLQQLETHTY